MKAIETIYNGYRFRSRLEARWAVFFDSLGIKYRYEPEGYDLNGVWYLPDFNLPDMNVWIEIKPTRQALEGEEFKVCRLSNLLNLPENNESRADSWQSVYVFIGEPYPDQYSILIPMEEDLTSGFELSWVNCPLCDTVSISHYNLDYSSDNTASVHCNRCDIVDRNWKETEDTWFWKGDVETKLKDYILESPRLIRAYANARQFRFGKNGRG